ncbi:OmpA family protein [Methylocystis sp. JAN1]|uniref:OmpA family protein n=1 Tax=Methylocystis sp. JAN1 TaxID=3397211 RepID=UPI003FA1D6A8
MSDLPAPAGVEAFEKIKSLLLGDMSRRLDETAERVEKLDDRLGDEEKFSISTGDALIDAFRRAEEKRPRALSKALAPSVVTIIRSEIKNSKDMMVEALYPIMGRLVTAAVAGAFRDLVESVNARIDALASASSWRLRLRAMATGRSMAEVALAEAEAGRLRRALLLERGSGRLFAIWPATEAGPQGANADLESGMIAAITEFATNVYADKGGELRMLDIGSGKVFLRASPRVIVAGEFGGELSAQREKRLDEAFLSIVELHEKDEEACTPDAIGGLLSDALTEGPARPKSKTPILVFGALLAGLVFWFSWEPILHSYREWRIRAAYADAMGSHPALAQYPLHLDIEHKDGRVVLRGLAANDAEPQGVMDAVARVADPYRVEREVQIVALASQTQQDLRAGETRAATTLQEAQSQIESLRSELKEARAAIERLVGEHDAPRAKLQRFIESFAVFFSGSDTLIDPAATAERLDELAALLKASDSGLRVVGYADEVGANVSNRSASRKRADKIVAMLVERGVPRNRLALVSRSTLNPIADSTLDMVRSRRVSFELPYAGEFDVR